MHATRQQPPAESRDPELIAEWEATDPISRFELFLQENGLATRDEISRVVNELQLAVKEAVDFAQASPYPDIESALQDLWVNCATKRSLLGHVRR